MKLQEQSKEELEAMKEDMDKDIFALTNELKTNRKLERPHLLREKKKIRARILTILGEKQRNK